MDASLTLRDFFKLIIFLLSMGALTYLIIVLKNFAGILSKVNKIAEENMEFIDGTIKELPEISSNINEITKTTNQAMKSMLPEVDGILHSVNSISGKVESITDSIDSTTYKVAETVDNVSDSISGTAFAFQNNISSISDYISIAVELIDTIKGYIKKR